MSSAKFEVKMDTSELDRMIAQNPAKLGMFLDMEAEHMVNGIKLSFGTSPPGRAYKRGRVTHIASRPKFPPNVDIGSLRASIDWAVDDRDKFLRIIHDGVAHGIMMELGTRRGIAPRPFMGPAFERENAVFADRLARMVFG